MLVGRPSRMTNGADAPPSLGRLSIVVLERVLVEHLGGAFLRVSSILLGGLPLDTSTRIDALLFLAGGGQWRSE